MFKAYHVVSYKEFVRYIKTKNDNYDYGKDIFSRHIIMKELNKYGLLLTSGKWGKIFSNKSILSRWSTLLKQSRTKT